MFNIIKSISFCLIFLLSSTALAQQYGSFKDSRDGHIYRTVKIGGFLGIGGQTWMADNLAINIGKNEPATRGYGRLYRSDATRGVCPIGWRLPTFQEYLELFYDVCGRPTDSEGGVFSWIDANNTCYNKLNHIGFNLSSSDEFWLKSEYGLGTMNGGYLISSSKPYGRDFMLVRCIKN